MNDMAINSNNKYSMNVFGRARFTSGRYAITRKHYFLGLSTGLLAILFFIYIIRLLRKLTTPLEGYWGSTTPPVLLSLGGIWGLNPQK